MKKKILILLMCTVLGVSCMTGCNMSVGTKAENIEVSELFEDEDITNYSQVLKDLDLDGTASKESHKMKNGDGEFTITIDDKEYTFTVEDNEITEVTNSKGKTIWSIEDKENEDNDDDKKPSKEDKDDDNKKPDKDDNEPDSSANNGDSITAIELTDLFEDLESDFSNGIKMTFVQDGQTIEIGYVGDDMYMSMPGVMELYVVGDYMYMSDSSNWYYTDADPSYYNSFNKDAFLEEMDFNKLYDALDDINDNNAIDLTTTTIDGTSYTSVEIEGTSVCFDNSMNNIVAIKKDSTYMMFDRINSITLPSDAENAEYTDPNEVGGSESKPGSNNSQNPSGQNNTSGSYEIYDYNDVYVGSFNVPSGYSLDYAYSDHDNGKYSSYTFENKDYVSFDILFKADYSVYEYELNNKTTDGSRVTKLDNIGSYNIYKVESDIYTYYVALNPSLINSKDAYSGCITVTGGDYYFTQSEFTELVKEVFGL